MKTIRVMDSTGDTKVEFEPNTAAEKEAKALFERLSSKGAAVFAIEKGGDSRRVGNFEELGDENVIVPAIIGG